jgi:pimeloyl-ACP methyl ester carboxylesterase
MDPAALKVPVADGVRLHVRHWPGDLGDGVAARLAAAGFPAYAVDLRSHGESERPEDGYDTATAASDVAAVAGALDLLPAVVAGQSWGGNVTVALAAKHPDRVRAIALVDGGWIDLRGGFGSWEACEARLRPPDLDGMRASDLADRLRRGHPDWEEWAIQATLANLHVDSSGRLTRRLPVPLHMRILRSMWDDPPSPLFASVPVPALLVPAVTDGDTRKRDAVARAAAALPYATIREYVGGDHDLHAQHPRRLAADLLMLAV